MTGGGPILCRRVHHEHRLDQGWVTKKSLNYDYIDSVFSNKQQHKKCDNLIPKLNF